MFLVGHHVLDPGGKSPSLDGSKTGTVQREEAIGGLANRKSPKIKAIASPIFTLKRLDFFSRRFTSSLGRD